MADRHNQAAAASRAIGRLLRVTGLALALLALTSGPDRADQVSDGFAAYQHGDYLAAYRLCRPLAEQGDRDAQVIIGLMYANGRGVRQSNAAAAEWYGLAADDGQSVAQNNLGMMYAVGSGVRQSYDEAAKLYRLAADQGNPRAQVTTSPSHTETARASPRMPRRPTCGTR